MPRKNAFSFFMEHYIESQKEKGRKVSKRIAAEECGPLWSDCSDEEKEIYCSMARAYKNRCVSVPVEKYQDPITGELGEAWRETVKSGADLKYLKNKITDESAVRNHNFYIIHCNYFCKVKCSEFLPAEIAISEFNLEEGVKRTYHTLVDPGQIPLGYAFETKRISGEVHGLPLPPYEQGEKDMKKIRNEILEFMEPSKDGDEYPPLFTFEDNALPSMYIIHNLTGSEGESPMFTVYPIYEMFFWLKNKSSEICGVEPGFPVLTNAVAEIEKDVFRFSSGISCSFHAESEVHYQNCSLSIVQRLAFIICEHCCRHLKIELVGGKHVHWNYIRRKRFQPELKIAADGPVKRTSNPTWDADSTSSEQEAVQSCSDVSTYASSVSEETTSDASSQTEVKSINSRVQQRLYNIGLENLILNPPEVEEPPKEKPPEHLPVRALRGRGSLLRGRGNFLRSSRYNP